MSTDSYHELRCGPMRVPLFFRGWGGGVTRYLCYFSKLSLKMLENVSKRSEFGSENSDILA